MESQTLRANYGLASRHDPPCVNLKPAMSLMTFQLLQDIDHGGNRAIPLELGAFAFRVLVPPTFLSLARSGLVEISCNRGGVSYTS